MVTATTALVLPLRRISWAAIIAGAFVALALALALALLGIGIGADPLHAGRGEPAAGALGSGDLWFSFSLLVALFAGGWFAGRLAGMPSPTDGLLHGIVVWSLTTLAGAYLLTTAGGGVLGASTGPFAALLAAGAAPAGAHDVHASVATAAELARAAFGAFTLLGLGALAAAGGGLLSSRSLRRAGFVAPPVATRVR